MCRAMQEILQALDPDPAAHVLGLGDNFLSTDLLSERQVRQRADAFIGARISSVATHRKMEVCAGVCGRSPSAQSPA